MHRLALVLLVLALQCGAAEIPAIDTRLMESQVRSLLEEHITDVRKNMDSAQAWGKLGQLLHAHERLNTAVTCYDQAIRLDTQNYLWPYLAAQATLGLRKADALAYLETACELAPENEALLVTQGNHLLQLGRRDDAQSTLRRALRTNPDSSSARVGLARIGLISGDLDAAINLLEEAKALNPRSGDIHTLLAQLYASQGNTERAALAELAASAYPIELRVYDPAIAEMESMAVSARAYARRGQKLADKGALRKAEAELRKVLTLREGTPTDFGNLATVLSRQGRHEEALDLFTKGLSRSPADVMLLSHQGLAFLEAGQLTDAEVSLMEATRLDPAYAEAHSNLGVLRFWQARYSEAIASFERALLLKPGLTVAYTNLGSALSKEGNLEGAIASWQQLQRIQPDNVALIYKIGLAQARLGRFREAIAELETGVTLAPRDPRVVSALARALVMAPEATLRDGERAAFLAQGLLRSRPGDPVALELLAAALAETGQFGEAVANAERAVNNTGGNEALKKQLQAAMARYRQGKTIHD